MATEPAAAKPEPTNTGIADASALAEETRTGEKKGKEVYASGLPASYNEEEFRKVFEKFCTRGTITLCRFRKHVTHVHFFEGALPLLHELKSNSKLQVLKRETRIIWNISEFCNFFGFGTWSHDWFLEVVGTQTGYGFLTFTNEQDGKDAIQQMNGKTLEGELVKVTDSASPSYSRSKTNLYIEGLPTDWNEERVKQLFSQFGTITEVTYVVSFQMMPENSGKKSFLFCKRSW